MVILGIDPGLKGGFGILNFEDQCYNSYKMPVVSNGTKKILDERNIITILVDNKPDIVIIEKVGAMPKQGVTSMFNFGCSWGMLRGMCAGLFIPYELVTPQAWKKVVLQGTKKDKGSAISYVLRRYPDLNVDGGKLDDGQADAICLAEYGRREFFKNGI